MELTPELAATLLPLYETNGAAIAESLNQCFDCKWTLAFGPAVPVDLADCGPDAGAEGLIVSLTAGERHLLIALPVSLPLPDWFRQPNMSQTSRLETLAMEWSLNCLPEDLPCDQFASVYVQSLGEGLDQCGLVPGSVWIPVTATSDSGTGRFFIVLAAERVPVASALPSNEPESAGGESEEPAPTSPGAEGDPATAARIRRLLKLPVKVVVKLAEKRMPLGQYLTLSPGAIVTFDKSCEDLLDLYVNNSLYARGEAVKIGEKFGLKINEVGAVHHRISTILHPHR